MQKYWYDANGNMTKRIAGDNNTFEFTYDAENRLVSVSGSATASFVYDGDGVRLKGMPESGAECGLYHRH